MVLKIHGHPQSTCTRRVIAVAKEKNVEYEVHSVDWTIRAYKTPEFMTNQPFGQMPYLVLGSLYLKHLRALTFR